MEPGRLLPFRDLADVDLEAVRKELLPALAIAAMAIPQGVAYAMIAGLPATTGLYAGAIPAIVGALFRSSRLVIVGPTNAVSLVLASSVAMQTEDPVAAAATIALFVGLLQLAAGWLRLASLVDYLSAAVVTGYVTGASVLIAVGQLGNATGSASRGTDLFTRFGSWLVGLTDLDPLATGFAAGTIGIVVALRQYLPRGIPMMIAMLVGTAAAVLFGLDRQGLHLVGDHGEIPFGFPVLDLPSLHGAIRLFPVAAAAALLSLVESTSIARTIASKTGQRLDATADFVGLGLANVSSAFFGGYPVSGSLSRSALALQLGAQTRAVGLLAGAAVLVSLLMFAPVFNFTPVPVVAGIVMVVAWDLLDFAKIRALLSSGTTDRAAFLGTLVGTWLLPLEQAIFVGVGISVVMFLRRARLLVISELRFTSDGHLHEAPLDSLPNPESQRCAAIRLVNVEGPLFFGAASELDEALFGEIDDPELRVLVVRLKRAHGIDYTTAAVLEHAHAVMEHDGRHLMLVGLHQDVLEELQDTGVAESFGADELYPSQKAWHGALNDALQRALVLVDEQPSQHRCASCAVRRYLARQGPAKTQSTVASQESVDSPSS